MTAGEAFLTQARSDWEVCLDLMHRRKAWPACHALHYLQMAVEKIAKAAICADDSPPPRTHAVSGRLVQLLQTPAVARHLGFEADRMGAYRALLLAVSPLFAEIERLHPAVPAGTQGPNVEYPWPVQPSSEDSEWVAPASHPFDLAERLRQGNGARLMDLLRRMFERAPVA